jgi:hypothetical protein
VALLTKVPVAIALLLLSITLMPQVFSQSSLTVTVDTDKMVYTPGETVTISGNVTDNQGNPVVGAAVSIEVNEPPIYVQLVASDQNGSYSNQFVLSNSFPQGNYTIFVTANKGNLTAAQETHFSVLTQTTTNTSSASSSITSSTSKGTPPTQCFIATATYGSEISPEVSLLRNLRDRKILHTLAGKSFMLAFNAFYYSFSPQVASYISSVPTLRDLMKILLYPLIGILYISDLTFSSLSFNGELAVAVAGIIAALGIGLVYFGPALLAFRKLKPWTFGLRRIFVPTAFCIAAVIGLALGELLGAPTLLTLATVATVLSFIFLGGVCTVCFAQLTENRLRKRAFSV